MRARPVPAEDKRSPVSGRQTPCLLRRFLLPGSTGGRRAEFAFLDIEVTQDGQLRLTQRFQLAELALPEIAVELRHQGFGCGIADTPQAGDDRSRTGYLQGTLQSEHALAACHGTESGLASGQHHQVRAAQVQRRHFRRRENTVIRQRSRRVRRRTSIGPRQHES